MKVFCWRAIAGTLGFSASVAGAAGAIVTVTQDLNTVRPRQVVAIPYSQIAAVLPDARMFHLVVRDSKNRVLPTQITNYQHDHRGVSYDDLVFEYDFAAGQKRVAFTLETTATATAPDAPCVYARFIPERLDDMAWENDRIAHRTYGAALNSPAAAAVGEQLRGSGIDVWGKRVTYPIVDRWYAKGHDQFHQDGEGEGLDLYSIGGSRGAGGTGVWDGTKLWTSDNFKSQQVFANGPRRAAFKLNYAPFDAGSSGQASETKQFTVDCGQNFDAVESVFDLPGADGVVGIGISDHGTAAGFPAPVLTKDCQGRWMSFWEENKDGGLGVAVVLAPDAEAAGFAREEAPSGKGFANNLLLVKAKDGVPVRYYTGAGWNQSGQFTDRASWEEYVSQFAAGVGKPLTLEVRAKP
jgi:pectinesterase